MLARTNSYVIHGLHARAVAISAKLTRGLPSFSMTGVPDVAAGEIRERVRAAILNEGFDFPPLRIAVTVEPFVGKPGPRLDLAVAAAILLASNQLPAEQFADAALIGELSLDGALHPVRGTLATATAAALEPAHKLFVPRANAQEALLGAAADVVALRRLGDLRDFIAGKQEDIAIGTPEIPTIIGPDLRDLRGHATPIRALEIAAAGNHNLLFRGPAGCGRTMLARRLPSILPPMTHDEALAVTNVHSIAGSLYVDGLAQNRPYRAPHDSTGASGLTGSNALLLPGEASLASEGVLFLDELNQFSTKALESLIPAIQDHQVIVTRDDVTYVFPARILLVAAAGLCACGHISGKCVCKATDQKRFESRMPGALAEHFDMTCDVERPTPAEVEAGPVTDSVTVRDRVVAARAIQTARYADLPMSCNGHLTGTQARRLLQPNEAVHGLLNDAYRHREISLRGYDRVLRISRTIADLDDSTEVHEHHALEALELASFAKPNPVPA